MIITHNVAFRRDLEHLNARVLFRKATQRYIQKTEPARNRLRYERERKGTKKKRKSAAKTAKENERFLLASSELVGT